MHKHSRLAIPAGYLDAQGLAPKLSPYSSWSHGLRFEHLHPHPIAQMSLETVAFAAGSTSSGCVLLTSYHILTKHSVSHWWFPMLKISPILPPPPALLRQVPKLGMILPPVLRCQLVEIRSTVSVVFL